MFVREWPGGAVNAPGPADWLGVDMEDVTPAPERWLPVPGYEGRYDVSDLGRGRSWVSPGRRTQPRILKSSPTSAGYLAVSLTRGDGRKTTRTIHSLVAAAFLGPRPAGQEVRHLDGNPLNNTLGNLAYGTRSENRQDVTA